MAKKVFLLTRFARLNARNRLSSSSHSSISKTMETDEAFSLYSSFILDLEDLDRSLEDGSISLQWCSKAMYLVKKMHLHFLQCFERLSQLPSSRQDPLTLTELYMRTSLDLLDLCNVLKTSVSGFFRWGLAMPFATRRLSSYERRLISDETVIAMIKEEEEKKKKKQRESIFRLHIDIRKRGVGGGGMKSSYKLRDQVKTTKLKGHCNLTDEVGAMQGAISMISSLVHCTIMQRAPVERKEEVVCYRVNHLNSLSGSIRSLVSSFMERQDRVVMLTEVQMIDSANSDYCDVVLKAAGTGSNVEKDEVFESFLLETLKRRSVALREGLELFESVVDEVFDDVIDGRKRVISSLVASETSSLV